jgi:hypothetical protein
MALTAQDQAKALAIVNQHADNRKSLAATLIKLLLGLWGSFDRWDNDDLIGAQAARSAVLVDTYLGRSRRLARSYATSMLRVGGINKTCTRGRGCRSSTSTGVRRTSTGGGGRSATPTPRRARS